MFVFPQLDFKVNVYIQVVKCLKSLIFKPVIFVTLYSVCWPKLLEYWNFDINIELKMFCWQKKPHILETQKHPWQTRQRGLYPCRIRFVIIIFSYSERIRFKRSLSSLPWWWFQQNIEIHVESIFFFYYFLKWNCRSKIETRQTSQLFMLVDYKTVINLMLLTRFNNL